MTTSRTRKPRAVAKTRKLTARDRSASYVAALVVPAGTRTGIEKPEAQLLKVRADDKGRIFSHIRQNWIVETPEERVRQAFVVTLHNEYGFGLDQMDEEIQVAGRGSAKARADVVLWHAAIY